MIDPLFVHFAPLSEGSQEWRTGEIESLDEDGFFVATNSLWPPETPLSLVLTPPGSRRPERRAGRVVWARSADPAGMFIALTKDASREEPAREPVTAPAPPSATDVRKPTT